jgi:hypothetical protein
MRLWNRKLASSFQAVPMPWRLKERRWRKGRFFMGSLMGTFILTLEHPDA